MAGEKYDVLLSYTSEDKPAVEQLARRLFDLGLSPFLDKWNLVPGDPWQEGIEEMLDACQTAAVFLGPSGIGSWENEEMRSALEERVRSRSFRVIPVLLPGATDPREEPLPRFLRRMTWVDFRAGLEDEDAFHRLVASIQGIAPGPPSYAETLSLDERKHILNQHRIWLESAGKEGRQADLSGANLRDADLSEAVLSQAILSGADLTRADLTRADLSRAALIDTVLRDADLRRANLFKADLTRAVLTGANLDGANLTQSIIEECLEIYRARNLDKAGVPGRLWLEARRHLEQFQGAVLPVKPIWSAREFEADPNLCFILMPFSNDPPYLQTQDVYQVHVRPTVERFGLKCLRADDIFGVSSIMEDIWHYILKARLIIADVTGRNPNVFYELGIAHTVGRAAVVIAQDEGDIPFDIRAFRYLKYELRPIHLKEFEAQLEQTIATILQRLPEQ